jgi:hypothetical protein
MVPKAIYSEAKMQLTQEIFIRLVVAILPREQEGVSLEMYAVPSLQRHDTKLSTL